MAKSSPRCSGGRTRVSGPAFHESRKNFGPPRSLILVNDVGRLPRISRGSHERSTVMYELLSIRTLGRRGVQLLLSVVVLLACVGLTLLREQLTSWLDQRRPFSPVEPIPIAGQFVESGWMGDAVEPGVLV